jgi:hypothetical protein
MHFFLFQYLMLMSFDFVFFLEGRKLLYFLGIDLTSFIFILNHAYIIDLMGSIILLLGR